MDLPIGKQNKEFWRKHVEGAKNFQGSQAAYCRQNGLVLSRFVYHRSQLLKKSKFSEVKPSGPIPSEARLKEGYSLKTTMTYERKNHTNLYPVVLRI